jgi:hypothetical protein
MSYGPQAAESITRADVLAAQKMDIQIAYPPNIDAIDKVFPGVKFDCTRRRYLAGCAERLAGPLYGHMVKKAEAKKLIETED